MDIKFLLQNLGAIDEATGGVDRLRDLIRGLAVRGRLVRQEQHEESATELLKQINQLRSEQTISKSNKRRVASDLVETSTELWNLPPSWQWSSLSAIATYIQRGKGPAYVEKSNLIVVSQKCVQWTGFDISRARFADEATLSSYGDERLLRRGDILWNSTGTGTVGRVNVFPGSDLWHSGEPHSIVADSHVTVIRLLQCDPFYVHLWLSSHEVQSTIELHTTGTTKQQELNLETVRRYPIPLPPAREQQRIVEKFQILMSLCDELEGLRNSKVVAQRAARASVFDAISRSASSEELSASWNMVQSSWKDFASEPDCADEIRNFALNMAAKGRLSEQSPKDEPA